MDFIRNFFEVIGISIFAILSINIIGGLWYLIIGFLLKVRFVEVVQNLGFLLSAAFIVFILKKYFNKSFIIFCNSVTGLKNKMGISSIIFVIVFISYLLVISVFYFLNLINLSFIEYNNKIFEMFLTLVLTFILIVIGEEIIFRGFLLNVISQKFYNPIIGIIVSSLFFSVSHFQYDNSIDYIIAFWGGLIMGFLYVYFDSIYPSLAFHFAWNFLYTFFLEENRNPFFTLNYLKKTSYSTEKTELFILVSISVLIFIYLFFKKDKYTLSNRFLR